MSIVALPNIVNLNGKKHTRGVDIPANPASGDTWEEILFGDNSLVGDWFWNGTYWLSKQMFQQSFSWNSITNNTIFFFSEGASNTSGTSGAIDLVHNLFLVSGTAAYFYPVGVSNGSNWGWRLRYHWGTNTTSDVVSTAAAVTIVNPVPTWEQKKISLYTHIDIRNLNVKFFSFNLEKVGNTPAFTGSYLLKYRLAR